MLPEKPARGPAIGPAMRVTKGAPHEAHFFVPGSLAVLQTGQVPGGTDAVFSWHFPHWVQWYPHMPVPFICLKLLDSRRAVANRSRKCAENTDLGAIIPRGAWLHHMRD